MTASGEALRTPAIANRSCRGNPNPRRRPSRHDRYSALSRFSSGVIREFRDELTFHCCFAHLRDSTSSGVVVEDLALAVEHVEDSTVDAFFAEQPVDSHVSGLAHSSCTGDGLFLNRGLEGRFAEDDDRGGLDVEADAAGLDLRDEDRASLLIGEVTDERETLLAGDRARDKSGGGHREPCADSDTGVVELGEDDDLSTLVLRVIGQFGESVQLRYSAIKIVQQSKSLARSATNSASVADIVTLKDGAIVTRVDATALGLSTASKEQTA